MGTIIGPFPLDDWYLMRELRRSINYMLHKDRGKYRTAIEKEQEIYKETLEKYVA